MSRKLRVVQWTTGKSGRAAVRGMVGAPRAASGGLLCLHGREDRSGRRVSYAASGPSA